MLMNALQLMVIKSLKCLKKIIRSKIQVSLTQITIKKNILLEIMILN